MGDQFELALMVIAIFGVIAAEAFLLSRRPRAAPLLGFLGPGLLLTAALLTLLGSLVAILVDLMGLAGFATSVAMVLWHATLLVRATADRPLQSWGFLALNSMFVGATLFPMFYPIFWLNPFG